MRRAAATCGASLSGFAQWCAHHVQPHERSEEHTSEIQSLTKLVCRLLLEKKKKDRTKDPKIEKQQLRMECNNGTNNQESEHDDTKECIKEREQMKPRQAKSNTRDVKEPKR